MAPEDIVYARGAAIASNAKPQRSDSPAGVGFWEFLHCHFAPPELDKGSAA
ncbi:hypothetical protein SM11_pC1443 (plasmid) [Sinorhizobium meliloti SM11]|uniref:Uncharacterized protein n=1 Tax=Sinorhizobium meliloti (strain SM11) TaxID=707241 RepID=F7XBJ8_SINMM|nr:hypothetical protein SM11_pC1443 [Sinorhizobium meliloti SM11]